MDTEGSGTPRAAEAAGIEVPPARVERLDRESFPIDHPKYQGIAEAKGYDQSYSRIEKVRYSHEAMVDMIVANPRITQNELAAQFGYTVSWISRVMGSDAFQGYLAKRREEITDPFLIATVEERLRGLASQSLDVIAEKLESTKSADIALKALDISVKALGFGARSNTGAGIGIQNNFVVQIPGKAPSEAAWAEAYAPAEAPIEMKKVEAKYSSSTIDRDPTIEVPEVTLADSEK